MGKNHVLIIRPYLLTGSHVCAPLLQEFVGALVKGLDKIDGRVKWLAKEPCCPPHFLLFLPQRGSLSQGQFLSAAFSALAPACALLFLPPGGPGRQGGPRSPPSPALRDCSLSIKVTPHVAERTSRSSRSEIEVGCRGPFFPAGRTDLPTRCRRNLAYPPSPFALSFCFRLSAFLKKCRGSRMDGKEVGK